MSRQPSYWLSQLSLKYCSAGLATAKEIGHGLAVGGFLSQYGAARGDAGEPASGFVNRR